MTDSSSQIKWLLLDHTDTLDRETIEGFSMFDRKGERKLEKLPICPICHKQIWLHAVTYMQNITFTGLLIGDAAWNLGMTFVVSERFKNYWATDGMKGLTFSSDPVNISFKKKTVFIPPSKSFFLAFPEPIITRFNVSSEVIYTERPGCFFCSSSEVNSIKKICFEEGTVDGIDCCIPSCLPGWVVVSIHFLKFVEKYKFMNFSFIEGFKRNEDRSLIRFGSLKVTV